MRSRRQHVQAGPARGARRGAQKGRERLEAVLRSLAIPRKRRVFAAGCFNRVHKAHVRMLQTARSLGDELVVVVSNDAHNHKRNAVPAKTRKGWLESLHLADKVVVGEADSFAKSIERERPDVLVLGYDQRMPDEATQKAVEALGVEVVQLPWFPGKEETCDIPEAKA